MLVPAYAVTIHKSQASEYPVVVIPVMTQHYAMLQRNLFYTGITRGKKLVVSIGQKKAALVGAFGMAAPPTKSRRRPAQLRVTARWRARSCRLTRCRVPRLDAFAYAVPSTGEVSSSFS
jgi:exodeoxyribonuclease V alpha subunit